MRWGAGGDMEGAAGLDRLAPSAADDDQLALDHEAPVWLGAGPFEGGSGRAGGRRLGEHVGDRAQHREPYTDPALAEGPEVDWCDVQRGGLRIVADGCLREFR